MISGVEDAERVEVVETMKEGIALRKKWMAYLPVTPLLVEIVADLAWTIYCISKLG